jgi:UDP-N-acetylmuramate--alanine ligase
MLPENAKRLHFIGIGGAGMSGIAWVLLKRGFQISGSDLTLNRMTHRLAEHGARILTGHSAEHLDAADAVIVSSAIAEDNPELLAALQRGIPVAHRADALDHIMRMGRAVAVAGTHGKTTTTSMTTLVAEKCGLDPTVLIGGELNDIGGNAKVGQSDLIIAEADESDGSFLKYHPHFAIVTNIEPDHLDFYHDRQAVEEAFRQFLSQTNPQGCAIVCKNDPVVRQLLPGIAAPTRTYGVAQDGSATPDDFDYCASDFTNRLDGVSFQLWIDGRQVRRVNLSVQGVFNAANALAVLAASEQLGLERERAIAALEQYRGVMRRFELKGIARGVTVIDDYAHHPTEVRATLSSARAYAQTHNCRRVIGVFQPHRFSRTLHLGEEFGAAFGDAEEVVITDVYSAGEEPIEGVDGRLIHQSVVRSGHPCASYAATPEELLDYLTAHATADDLVLTLGAGDVWRIGEQLLQRLEKCTP